MIPASKNRIVKRTRGSAESNPNFPATEADAQSMEKRRPVMIVCEEVFNVN